MRVRILSAFGALLSIVGTLLLTRCADKGTDPPPDGPKDYAVYFVDFAGPVNKIFRYHVVSHQLDSAEIPSSLDWRFFISADGKRIYWRDGQVYDAETFVPIALLPHSGVLAVSPDNQLIAVCDTDLFILRTSDYSVVFHDTDAVSDATFSANSKRFYAKKAASESCSPMYVVDLERGNQVTRRCIKGGMGGEPLVVSPDETKLYLYKHHGTFLYSFDVYDLQLDSIIFSKWLVPGQGTIAQTPNGSDVYLTSPGGFLVGPPALYSLGVYNAQTTTVDTMILSGDVCSYGTRRLNLHEVAITADGRWLIANNGVASRNLTICDLTGQDTLRVVCAARVSGPPVTQNGRL